MRLGTSALGIVLALAGTAPGLGAQGIHAAVASGDSAAVAATLAADNSQVGALDAQRRTPLHVAAGSGRLGLTALLLSRGAPLEARDALDFTPLMRAVFGRQAETAALLIDRGADVQARSSRFGMTVAEIAAQREAFGSGAALTRLLLSRGGRLDHSGGPRGVPPLTLASGGPNLEMMRLLLDYGARPDDGGTSNRTPLANAAMRGHADAVRLLLERGAAVDLPGYDGLTPLRLAVEYGRAETARLLLDRGGDAAADRVTGRTLLHTAALAGYVDVVRLLSERGIAPNAADSSGRTALDYARRYGHTRVAEYLAAHGGRASRRARNWSLPSVPRRGLRDGEAMAWYLANRGWAVRTTSHVLVFDAEEFGITRPTEPSLANGFPTAAELRDAQVVAAYTCFHGDPGERAYVHTLEDSVPSIFFVANAGDRWRGTERARYLRARADTVVSGVRLRTVDAPTGETTALGHLAEVDGVVMYYQGFEATDSAAFAREIEWLAAGAPRVDVAFLPIPEPDGDGTQMRMLLERLRPRAVLLLDPNRRVSLFPAVAERIRQWRPGTEVFTAENPGDRYMYRRR